jgi:hypothetical protein
VSIPVYTVTGAPEQLEILAGHVGFLPTVVLKDVLARAIIKTPATPPVSRRPSSAPTNKIDPDLSLFLEA